MLGVLTQGLVLVKSYLAPHHSVSGLLGSHSMVYRVLCCKRNARTSLTSLGNDLLVFQGKPASYLRRYNRKSTTEKNERKVVLANGRINEHLRKSQVRYH